MLVGARVADIRAIGCFGWAEFYYSATPHPKGPAEAVVSLRSADPVFLSVQKNEHVASCSSIYEETKYPELRNNYSNVNNCQKI